MIDHHRGGGIDDVDRVAERIRHVHARRKVPHCGGEGVGPIGRIDIAQAVAGRSRRRGRVWSRRECRCRRVGRDGLCSLLGARARALREREHQDEDAQRSDDVASTVRGHAGARGQARAARGDDSRVDEARASAFDVNVGGETNTWFSDCEVEPRQLRRPLRRSDDDDLVDTPGDVLNVASAPNPMRVTMTAGTARLMNGPSACGCS